MKKMLQRNIGLFSLIAMMLLVVPSFVLADDFSEYNTNGKRYDIELPEITYGWFVALDFFPDGTTAAIGNYEAEGRILCANDHTIYLQQNHGTSKWVPVATVTGMGMDPSFLHISPDGSTIALGKGYMQPLLVFPTSILNVANPPVLDTHAQTKVYPNVNYYDAEWLNNQYLLVNGGWTTGSEVRYVDVINHPLNTYGAELIVNFPGASADVTVDNAGHVITGDGYSAYTTGEIRLFTNAEITDAITLNYSLDYGVAGAVLAECVLSAAGMGVDVENNLHVGGGNWLQSGELGFVALINHTVLTRVANGGLPVDESNSSEYKEIQPDACGDDTATFATYSSWSKGLALLWNPAESGCLSPGYDMWTTGVVPVLSIYYPDNAPNDDADSIPDGSDNAYLTTNEGQQDADDDGWANVADGDFDGSGNVDNYDRTLLGIAINTSSTDLKFDMNCDGSVDVDDRDFFNPRYLTAYPWY